MKVEEELQATLAESPAAKTPNWLLLAYSFEYLIALLAAVLIWTQVGGQGHMDLIAWYLKLACLLFLPWCAVRFTAAIVEQPAVWNRRSRWWLGGLVLTGVTMAVITLYYHLHETTDEPGLDEGSAKTVTNAGRIRPATRV